MANVARLGVPCKAGAGAEGEELSGLGGGEALSEQDEAGVRVLDAELADRECPRICVGMSELESHVYKHAHHAQQGWVGRGPRRR